MPVKAYRVIDVVYDQRRQEMKQSNVRKLYLVKQMMLKSQEEDIRNKVIQIVNSVLLDENGSKAVLYPYNSLRENILQLWGEAMKPKDIAAKLNLSEDGEEIVLCVIEDPANYPPHKSHQRCL